MRRIVLLILGLIVAFGFSGFFFSSVSRSGEQGDYFYSCVRSGDYEKIIVLLDDDLLSSHPKEYWLKQLNARYVEKGSLVSFKNTGFHTETIDGKSISMLDYIVTYTNGQMRERLDFVKEGSAYKIIEYEFSDDIQNKLVSN